MLNVAYWVKNPGRVFGRLKRFTVNREVFVYEMLGAMGLRCPDRTAVKAIYFKVKGKRLNLRHPQTFNEKLNLLKIRQHDPRLTDLVDKVKAKEIVGRLIGPEHIIKTLGVWRSFDDIDFNSLPERFVLKTNHDSGTVMVCRSKATFDFDKARRKLSEALMINYYDGLREWPYKNVERRILAEEFVEITPPIHIILIMSKLRLDLRYKAMGAE